ncbi:MAG: hypothetical protein QXN17_06575 [Nitrososphaerota archaeon]
MLADSGPSIVVTGLSILQRVVVAFLSTYLSLKLRNFLYYRAGWNYLTHEVLGSEIQN